MRGNKEQQIKKLEAKLASLKGKSEDVALANSMKYWKRNGVNIVNEGSLKMLSWTTKNGELKSKQFKVFKTDNPQIPELVFAGGLLKKVWS